MAFKGRDTSASTGGNGFVRHKGIGMFEIAAINPNAKELTELFGKPVEEEPNYITERDGIKKVKIRVYLRNITGGATSNFVTPVDFWLENQLNEYEGSVKVIDKYGNHPYIKKEDYEKKIVPERDDKGRRVVLDKDYRACLGDEDLLVQLIKAHRNIDRPDEYINGEWVLKSGDKLASCEASLEHIKDYFKGDFSELKEIISEFPNNKLQALLGPKKDPETGREYQDVFKFWFPYHWDKKYKELTYWYNNKKDKKYPNTDFELCPLQEVINGVTPTDLSKPNVEQMAELAQDTSDDLPF